MSHILGQILRLQENLDEVRDQGLNEVGLVHVRLRGVRGRLLTMLEVEEDKVLY